MSEAIQGIVRVNHEFFRKERNNAYSNWKDAFWREMFQNSVDAGSNNIYINIKERDNGHIEVEFNDDGCGMNKDILLNVFMNLGETTKGGFSTGGFGRARIMTHFSMVSYEILTGNNKITGHGCEYELTENEYVNGCSQRIIIDDSYKDSMLYELHTYLQDCQISCSIFINNEKWNKWLYRRQIVRTLKCGNVHVNKSSSRKQEVIVRVNGTRMFKRYTSANSLVIIEIYPNISRDVLTSNRDGINHDYQQEIDEFLSELSVDTKTALKPRFKDKTKIRKGTGHFITRSKKGLQSSIQNILSGSISTIDSEQIAIQYAEVFGDTKDILNTVSMAQELEKELEEEIDIHDVIIIDECVKPEIRKIIDSYDPTNWVTSYYRGKEINFGSTKFKLLTAWKVAIKNALDILQEIRGGEDIVWGVGWVFEDKNTIACHRGIDGVHYFVLNPVKDDGKMAWRLTGTVDKSSLFALALHEVCHIYCKYHDESFSSLYTSLCQIGMDKRNEVLREIKESISKCFMNFENI